MKNIKIYAAIALLILIVSCDNEVGTIGDNSLGQPNEVDNGDTSSKQPNEVDNEGTSSKQPNGADNGDNSSKQPVVIGYLPRWKMPYAPQWQKLTHVCLAFGVPNSDGSLRLKDMDNFKQSIVDAHNNNVKVLLSIGGGGTEYFSEAILDSDKRKLLTENIIKAVTDYNVDGIDIDFEEWEGSYDGANPQDLLKRAALENLYKELREKAGNEKLITAAISPSWDDGSGSWGFYNCYNSSMYQYLDYVSLMLYDETGYWSKTNVGQHSTWDYFENAIDYWLKKKNLPKEKLVAGVPFYGWLFKSANNAEGAEVVAYRDILNSSPNQDAHLKDNIDLLYYNGMGTIQKKAKYIRDNNLGGIMIWELTQDADDAGKSLLNAIHDEMK